MKARKMKSRKAKRLQPASDDEPEISEILSRRREDARCRYDRVQLIIQLCATALITYIIFGCVLGIAIVRQQSMEPTLENGSLVVYVRFERDPDVGDIIIIEPHDKNIKIIKRVAATETDTVEVSPESHAVRINGAEIYCGDVGGEYTETTVLGAGEYFVLGDNLPVSIDSREYGTIEKSEIRGKVILSFHFGQSG